MCTSIHFLNCLIAGHTLDENVNAPTTHTMILNEIQKITVIVHVNVNNSYV